MQSFSSSSQIKAGRTAQFVIWVWSAKAASSGVTVTASVPSSRGVGSPSFSSCPVPDGTVCKVGNLPVGQADELEVGVKVGTTAGVGEQVELLASAAAPGASPWSSSASDVVVLNPVGVSSEPTLPTTSLPPPSVLPTISGTGVTAGNPGSLFPTVGASSTAPASGSVSLPPASAKPLHAQDASATVPVDTRLIGGQLAGLAVLAGAIAIAIARLSLRAPKSDAEKKD